MSSCHSVSIEQQKIKKTPADALAAFAYTRKHLVIEVGSLKVQELLYTASGICVEDTEKYKNVILASGHFCEPDEPEEFDFFNDLKEKSENEQIESSFVVDVIFDDGTTHEASVIKYQADENADLCLLALKDAQCQSKISVADRIPSRLDHVLLFGAPNALFNQRNIIVFDGRYMGINSNKWMTFTTPATFGSSGAPIVNDDMQVVSVVRAITNDFQFVAFGNRLEKIYEFLNI